jgi:hypothetical protein
MMVSSTKTALKRQKFVFNYTTHSLSQQFQIDFFSGYAAAASGVRWLSHRIFVAKF